MKNVERAPNRLWRPIKDYEGLYEVSNMGEVRSVKEKQGGRLKDRVNGCLSLRLYRQYKGLFLYKNKKRKGFLVHRLVADAFIPNPDNLAEVNHINEDKLDNRVENLEWVTHAQNIAHSHSIEKAYTKISKIVLVYKEDGTFVCEYPSVRKTAKAMKIDFGAIQRRIAKDSSKAYKGYIFKQKQS